MADYPNSIIIFKKRKGGNNEKAPSYWGFVTVESIKHEVVLWEKTGEYGVFYSGISKPYREKDETSKDERETDGNITIFVNRSNTDKAPDLKGFYKTKDEVEYNVSLWKKQGVKGLFWAGTIKIKDPEMKYKAESQERVITPDSNVPAHNFDQGSNTDDLPF